jgi:hypothetical protein
VAEAEEAAADAAAFVPSEADARALAAAQHAAAAAAHAESARAAFSALDALRLQRIKAYVDLGSAELRLHLHNIKLAGGYARGHSAALNFATTMHAVGASGCSAEDYREARMLQEPGLSLPSYKSASRVLRRCMEQVYGPPAVEVHTVCPIAGHGSVVMFHVAVSLRAQFLQTLTSAANAKGSLVLLGSAADVAQAQRLADYSGPLCMCRDVQAVAAGIHREFAASGLEAALRPFARELGKSKVRVFPAVVQLAEDGTNASKRVTFDPCTCRPCYVAPWAQNSPHTVLLAGLIRLEGLLRSLGRRSCGRRPTPRGKSSLPQRLSARRALRALGHN